MLLLVILNLVTITVFPLAFYFCFNDEKNKIRQNWKLMYFGFGLLFNLTFINVDVLFPEFDPIAKNIVFALFGAYYIYIVWGWVVCEKHPKFNFDYYLRFWIPISIFAGFFVNMFPIDHNNLILNALDWGNNITIMIISVVGSYYFFQKRFNNDIIYTIGLLSICILTTLCMIWRDSYYLWMNENDPVTEIVLLILFTLSPIIYILNHFNYNYKLTTHPGDENYHPLDDKEDSYNLHLNAQEEALKETIHKLFSEEQIYLDSQISLESLAHKVNKNRTDLSTFLNRRMKTNFYSLVNYYRIKDAINLMTEEPDRTINSISLEVGYNNRSVFISAFKKMEGMTPSEWKANLK